MDNLTDTNNRTRVSLPNYPIIDTHVHGRDEAESEHETLAHLLSVAERVGCVAVCDMLNTTPPGITRAFVEQRIAKAKKVQSPVEYFCYPILTPDSDQQREIVRAYAELPEVVALKFFMGPSSNNPGFPNKSARLDLLLCLARENYTGPVVAHCELPELCHDSLFDIKHPWTHCEARPACAEYKAVEALIEEAQQSRFGGHLHIAHTSTPESVQRVHEARKAGMRISCAITPHHLFLSEERLHGFDGKQGVFWKMNPPLRSAECVRQMQSYLYSGLIDWIETDHAPWNAAAKMSGKSGIPSLVTWPRVIDLLVADDYSQARIRKLVFENARKTFPKLGGVAAKPVYDVNKDLHKEYSLDPFDGV